MAVVHKVITKPHCQKDADTHKNRELFEVVNDKGKRNGEAGRQAGRAGSLAIHQQNEDHSDRAPG
jgi:hypothetical protein